MIAIFVGIVGVGRDHDMIIGIWLLGSLGWTSIIANMRLKGAEDEAQPQEEYHDVST